MTGGIIGRDDELSVMDAFLDRPMEGMRALVLEGAAGIGKSTIWQAGVAAARDRSLRVLVSRPAETERTLPYVVLGDLFAGVEPDALAELEPPRRLAFESALLRTEADHPVDPRALGVAIHTLQSALSRTVPVVLAIDDDQWMDASSSATLAFALRRSVDQPVLLLISRRTGVEPIRALEETIDAVGIERIRVGALSVGATQLLLRNRLNLSFPRPTLVRLHEASGGNPFYALELARARTMDPARQLSAPMTVPPSLERLVAARIEALDAHTRKALLLVAVHGRMPVGLLQTVGIPDHDLEPAYLANIVESVRDVISFTHPLLASAIYQGALEDERRFAHKRLAAALNDAVERGRHLALASSETNERTAAELESAALVARARGMPLAGAELAEHAIRLTPVNAPDDRHRRAISAARAHREAGDGSRARAIASDVLAQARSGAERAEAIVVMSELEDPGPARELLEKALVEAAGTPALQAVIHADLALAARATKGRAWGERHARESHRLAGLLMDESLSARAFMMLAHDSFERGDPDGLERVEQAHQQATALAHPDRVSWADTTMGWALMFSTEYGRAREWLIEHLDHWRDRDEQMRSQLLWLLALTEFWTGHWDTAGEQADQVRDISEQYGEIPTDHLAPSLIALHRGQIASARTHSQRALSLARGHLLPQHRAILGICELWTGNPSAAVVGLLEAEQTAERRGWDEPNIRWWRADYADALLQLGRLDDAARLIDAWDADAARVGRGRAAVHVLRCRGLLAAARGDIAAAVEFLERAADRYGAIEDPFNRGRSLLALGVVRLRARQKRSARLALESALAAFEALGATGWARTARSELARVGGRERIVGLSSSERRVAELVAEGRTNREIAAALFLGERTVASHLTHIYAKLGIRSRTELARALLALATESADDASKVPTS